MIEAAVLAFVAWNATLQTAWFVWSYRHHRKHFTDDTDIDTKDFDSMIVQEERDYYKRQYEDLLARQRAWDGFITTSQTESQTETVPVTEATRSPQKKYDPEKISGMFDSVFEDKNMESK